jgi:hypothetical protein
MEMPGHWTAHLEHVYADDEGRAGCHRGRDCQEAGCLAERADRATVLPERVVEHRSRATGEVNCIPDQ